MPEPDADKDRIFNAHCGASGHPRHTMAHEASPPTSQRVRPSSCPGLRRPHHSARIGVRAASLPCSSRGRAALGARLGWLMIAPRSRRAYALRKWTIRCACFGSSRSAHCGSSPVAQTSERSFEPAGKVAKSRRQRRPRSLALNPARQAPCLPLSPTSSIRSCGEAWPVVHGSRSCSSGGHRR